MVKAFYSFRDTLPEVACYGKHNTGYWRVFCAIQQVNKPLIKTERWEFNIHLLLHSKNVNYGRMYNAANVHV